MNGLALAVWLAVGLSSTLLIARVTAVLRGPRADGTGVHDVYEAAFLSGGPARTADAAIAALQADGRIAVGGPGIVTVLRPVAHDPVERSVFDALAAGPSGALGVLRAAVMRGPAVQEVGDGLAARGLVHPPGSHRALVAWGTAQGILCVLATPVSFLLTVVALFADEPALDGWPFFILVLPVLAAGTVIGFSQAARVRRRVSRSGRQALAAYRAAAHTAPSAAGLVALHGVRSLPDPVFAAQLTAAARQGVLPPAGTAPAAAYAYGAGTPYPEPVWCGGPGGSGPGWDSGPGSGGSGCGGSSGGGCGGSSGSSGSSCGGSSGSSCGGGSSG
ncbi:TIGR04222 domain-containing membrane protein [Streptomyces sp. NPDC005805]|uniref:TIGR04222 domain-containing membrane protein n=1 Tax=Streptomyces sp. NPDC005805 TaxID=3157068 RepID=UPI0033E92DD2